MVDAACISFTLDTLECLTETLGADSPFCVFFCEKNIFTELGSEEPALG